MGKKVSKKNSHPKEKKRIKVDNPHGKRRRKRKQEGIKNKQKQYQKSMIQKSLYIFLQLIIYGFMIFIIGVAILFTFSRDKHQSILGYQFYNVLTNSMVPQKDNKQPHSFYAQDIIIVQKTSYENLKKGDVVSFEIGDGATVLTHRLVDKKNKIGRREGEFLITKGDANPSQDPPISADKLIGKVVLVIPKMGIVVNFVRDNIWLCLLFVVSLLGSIYVLRNYFLIN